MSKKYAFFRGCMIPIKLPYLEKVARTVLPRLDVELVDISEFSCCPDPSGFGSLDRLTWLAIAARNISLAEEKGLDVITLCNGCAQTLCQANHALKKNEALKDKVNGILEGTGHKFNGTVKVNHFLHIMAKDIGPEEICKRVKVPLTNLKVATFTGCHLLSPPEVMNFDYPWDPIVFDKLVASLGAKPVDYDLKPTCCGLWLPTSNQVTVIADKLVNMKSAGATCISVACPFCFQQFDLVQLLASRKMNLGFKIPVLNFLQLLGLALGYSLEDMQYQQHKTKDPIFEKKVKEG
jgi:heterodisulfide reductase subunit B